MGQTNMAEADNKITSGGAGNITQGSDTQKNPVGILGTPT